MCPEQGPEHQQGTEVKHTVLLWPGAVKNGDSPLIYIIFLSLLHSYRRVDRQDVYICSTPHILPVLWSLHPYVGGLLQSKHPITLYLSGRPHTTACGVYVHLSVCVSVYVCAKHERVPGFYCLPLPSTDPYVSPPFSVSLIQPVHQWPYK